MAKTSIFGASKPETSTTPEYGETLLTLRDRDGIGSFSVRAGQVSAFQPDVNPSARLNPDLGVELILLSGAAVRLSAVSAATVQAAFEKLHGERFSEVFAALPYGGYVRTVHVTALTQATQPLVHLIGGQEMILSQSNAAALLGKVSVGATVLEYREPAVVSLPTAPPRLAPEAPLFDIGASYNFADLVRHNGSLWRCVSRRGAALIEPGTNDQSWAYIRTLNE